MRILEVKSFMFLKRFLDYLVIILWEQFSHSLNLVIKERIFSKANVTNLIEKIKKIVSHANSSTKFYTELYKHQKVQMNLPKNLRLITDIMTRWNSTYLMLQRFVFLKPALVSTLASVSGIDFHISKSEWDLASQICQVLKTFEDATKMLSEATASISMVLPIISEIMHQLESSRKDHGIIGWKDNLLEGMINRFNHYESLDEYSLSTFFNTKYKGYCYRNPETLEAVKTKIYLKLEDILIDENANQSESPQVNVIEN